MAKRTNVARWDSKSNRWVIKVQKDGIRKSFYSSVAGRKGQIECHNKADAWLEHNISNTNRKIREITAEYIEHKKLTTSKSNWRQLDGYVRNWIDPKIGNIKIGSLSEMHLQSVLDSAYAAKLSNKTLNNIRACLQNFLKYCRKANYTQLHVEDLVIRAGAYTKEKTILQPDDLKLLFSNDNVLLNKEVQYDIYVNAYRFEVLTGLRPGEVFGLQWNDIKNGIVHLKRSINRYGEITNGKNKNARRDFALTPLAQSVIEAQKRKCKELGIKSDYIFTTEEGEHISQSTYYKRWVKYREFTGMQSTASPYELRHTFVSAVKTLPEGYLKQVVGHSKDMDTYGIYSHKFDGDMRKTADLIQDIFEDIISSETDHEAVGF